jgi:uncharacterized membrane protein
MVTCLQWAAAAEEAPARSLPERSLEMAVEYPSVVVAPEEDVSMDVIFHNGGRSNEDVSIDIATIPEGWKAKVKTYRYTIAGVHVPADDDKRITFEATPDKEVKPGTYEFLIKAHTDDGRFTMAQKVVVTVTGEEEATKEAKGAKLTTSYPVLRGPSDATFEFSIDVSSELDKDAVFDLFAQGPEDWDVNFKPAYESKYISSLRLKAGQSKAVAVEVKPAPEVQAGDYPVNVRVSSGDAKAEAQLTVTLTGTYKLEAGTLNGLLSLSTRQGNPANMSVYVKNTGSAPNNDIRFMSFKPENWEVEFEPERIPTLEPDELKQVEVIITPYEEALVGDYSVAMTVQGEKVSKDIEFRVTVKESAAWGWIGIAIIILVILGLLGLFRWLGRR